MRCVVVASDAALVAACVAAADGVAGIDVVAAVPRSRVLGGAVPACEVLLVADDPGAPAAEWRRTPRARARMRRSSSSREHADIDAFRSALRAGAGAVAALPITSPGLAAAVTDALRVRRAGGASSSVRQGGVVAVVGARGGVGASMVALGLAATAKALLVDLAGSRAGLAFALGARPDRSLADLAQAGEALASGVGTIVVEHPAGLRHVAGPPDPDLLGTLTSGWGSELVRELRVREGLSVIDVGCAVSAAPREALVAADRVLVVVTPTRSRARGRTRARPRRCEMGSGRRARDRRESLVPPRGHRGAGDLENRGRSSGGRRSRRPPVDVRIRRRAARPRPLDANGSGSDARRPCGRDAGMNAFGAMADRYRVRVREEMTVLPPGADTRELRSIVAARLRELLERDRVILPVIDMERLVEEVVDDAVGLGPLEPLMRDPAVTEVIANGPGAVFVERGGKLVPEAVRFRDAEHLRQVVERVVGAGGRRVDDASPMVDVRLPDGSRVNAVLPPLALDGPLLTIRRFPSEPMTIADLVDLGTVTPGQVDLLGRAVRGRVNIVVSGGTGTGKTTLLNALAGFVGRAERIVTVEDAAELRLPGHHVARLESRPPNVEGRGEVTLRALVRNALRMRPDRIVVGEVRGGEALDMLQAMNTGHDGSLTTVHASSTADALRRIETMALMAGLDLPHSAVRDQVQAAVDVVIHLVRTADGARVVRGIDGRDDGARLRQLDNGLLGRLVEARCAAPSG